MLSTMIRENLLTRLPDVMRQPRPMVRPKAFPRKVKLDFAVRGYRVKTIETHAELKQVLSLRRNVFHHEFAGKWFSFRSDRDEYDDLADHLAIFDAKTGRLAGAYRMIPSHASDRFYSATEFDISRILALPGRKIELSRACIHKDYRNGIVIALLWKGIAEYAKAAGTDYLFGLSSINTIDPAQIAAICRYFEKNDLVDRSLDVAPRGKYAIDGFADHLEKAYGSESGLGGIDAVQLVPSLFKTYIKAGAKVCWQPVIDRDFRCADWLTVLDMKKLAPAFGRKFMQD